MPTKLRKLRLTRIDVVDRPANPMAQVAIYKRATDPSWLDAERAYFAKSAEATEPPSSEDALIQALRAALASSYSLYLAAHAAHWNVEGPEFPAWHEFFGELYKDVFGAIDTLAESLRQHYAYAPASFYDIFTPGSLTPIEKGVGGVRLLNAAQRVALTGVKDAAEAAGDVGLSNFCQDRLAAHLKTDWQLRAMEKLS